MIKVEKPTDEQKKEAETWPVWEKEVSEFPYSYSSQEVFLVVEGKATVTPDDGEAVTFGAGDLVTMPNGMKCTWKITEPIKKHYRFG